MTPRKYKGGSDSYSANNKKPPSIEVVKSGGAGRMNKPQSVTYEDGSRTVKMVGTPSAVEAQRRAKELRMQAMAKAAKAKTAAMKRAPQTKVALKQAKPYVTRSR